MTVTTKAAEQKPARPLRIGIVVGEASGDILGAGLINEISAATRCAV